MNKAVIGALMLTFICSQASGYQGESYHHKRHSSIHKKHKRWSSHYSYQSDSCPTDETGLRVYDPSNPHCRRFNPCPDRYSCTPLYGSYGPFGGQAFWGVYTDP
jgi:hypothetical protein